jgi:hypothetical protein
MIARASSRHARTLAVAAVLLAMLAPLAALAGTARSGARALFLAPSVRASGLGGAGGALWWGGDPDDWANPALLPDHRGLRYGDMSVDLLPGVSDDTRFTSQRLTAAWGGVGVLAGGKLGLADGGRLDMGRQLAVDEAGDPRGYWHPWAETESFGVGLDLVWLAEALDWGPPAPERWRLAIGHTWKTYTDLLAPGELMLDSRDAGAEVDTKDLGAHGRWRAIDTRDTADGWLRRHGGAQLDLAASWSRLNYDEASVVYIDDDQRDPIARVDRLAASARLAAAHLDLGAPDSWLGRLGAGLSPLLSVGVVYEQRDRVLPAERDGVRDWDDWSDREQVTAYGVELTLANVFSYRLGHVDDDGNGIAGGSSGWSVGLDLGRVGGFRYDEATVPQSDGLDDVTREGWTAFVDVVELVNLVQTTRGGR